MRAERVHVFGEQVKELYKRKARSTLKRYIVCYTKNPNSLLLALHFLIHMPENHSGVPPVWFFSRACLCTLGEDARLNPSNPNTRGVTQLVNQSPTLRNATPLLSTNSSYQIHNFTFYSCKIDLMLLYFITRLTFFVLNSV